MDVESVGLLVTVAFCIWIVVLCGQAGGDNDRGIKK